METPFYYRLFVRVNPLAFPLFMHLSDLKQRYYQGESYRGVKMTREELSEYRCALKNKDNVIVTARFASTSTVRLVAEKFLTQSSFDNTNVLLIFQFPQVCDTAINLGKLPEQQLPSISLYEDEREVLIAPRTFFRIKNIETNEFNGQHIIYLENISSEHKTVLGTVYFFIKNHFEGEGES
jgi:hypothetical protein